jgi:hypothetical protein
MDVMTHRKRVHGTRKMILLLMACTKDTDHHPRASWRLKAAYLSGL